MVSHPGRAFYRSPLPDLTAYAPQVWRWITDSFSNLFCHIRAQRKLINFSAPSLFLAFAGIASCPSRKCRLLSATPRQLAYPLPCNESRTVPDHAEVNFAFHYGLAGLSELNAATFGISFFSHYMQLQSLSDRWCYRSSPASQRHLEHFTGIVGQQQAAFVSGFHRSAQLVTDFGSTASPLHQSPSHPRYTEWSNRYSGQRLIEHVWIEIAEVR